MSKKKLLKQKITHLKNVINKALRMQKKFMT